MSEFVEFPKIARLSRRCIITEKIDGTNVQVHVREDGQVLAGSRNQYIKDNAEAFGFMGWVRDHEDELRAGLGIGRHYGEWWGAGIQRGYGLGENRGTERRFSLFNVDRWGEARPACCHVVPVLFGGIFTTVAVDHCLKRLRDEGSAAAPGFMRPEGVVIWHEAAKVGFKKTIDKDEEWKGKAKP